ncbi:hypothetical protein AUK10_04180 [Candidatus Gracilibacteria bacterium CG2_30_37_12]|nr:MAG: hypothetical protein AUK10_04180 [Candidatus Gracilibacteria bacterium CG2_30_37_12]
MLEIFIPTEIPDILLLHRVDSGFLALLQDNFVVTIRPFETRFFRGFHITSKDLTQDIVTLCNGTFGSEYFIDYDWENTHIMTLGKRFFQPDSIGQELQSITSDFDSIVRTLNSDTLLTNSKKEESIQKIQHSFFLLSGVIFNLTELLRKTREHVLELEVLSRDASQKSEYQGQSALLMEPLKTKEIELTSSIVLLEQKIAMFIDVTKFLIKG